MSRRVDQDPTTQQAAAVMADQRAAVRAQRARASGWVPGVPKATHDVLVVWVPLRLVNELNARLHNMQSAKLARRQKDAVAMAFYLVLQTTRRKLNAPRVPKHVHFEVHVWNWFDSADGLRAACKHVLDALKGTVIDDDADRCGHLFSYAQVIDRAHRGVEISVRLRAAAR